MGNSKPHENLAYHEYKLANPTCEIVQYFPRTGRMGIVPWRPGRETYIAHDEPAGHCHHIAIGNTAKRKDVTTNLIHLCHESHRWVHEFNKPGFVLCLYSKWKKNELDVDVLGWVMGGDVHPVVIADYLTLDKVVDFCEWDFIERYRAEMVRHLPKEEAA